MKLKKILKKMHNGLTSTEDNELTSAEGKYLLYIIDSISDLENKINETLKDRDFKLKLVLYDEYSDFKDNIDIGINEVKKMINQLDLKNLDAKQLESIASMLNYVIDFFEYNTKTNYVDNNS